LLNGTNYLHAGFEECTQLQCFLNNSKINISSTFHNTCWLVNNKFLIKNNNIKLALIGIQEVVAIKTSRP